MSIRAQLPRAALLVAGGLFGFVIVAWVASMTRAGGSPTPIAEAPGPSDLPARDSAPAAPAPALDPADTVDASSLVAAARAATAPSAARVAASIAACLREQPDLAPELVRDAVRLAEAGDTLPAEVLLHAVSEVPDSGVPAIRSALFRALGGSAPAVRTALIRAACRWRLGETSGGGAYVGARRGLLCTVGGPVEDVDSIAAVARCHRDAAEQEVAVRIEALWGLSGELARDEVAACVARSLDAGANAAEREVAIVLASRVVERGLPTRALVEELLSSSVPPDRRASLSARTELESAVRDRGDLDAVIDAHLSAGSVDRRLALARALEESRLLHRAAAQPGGEPLIRAARTLAADESRGVRAVAAHAVGALLRGGSWSAPELADDLYRLLADPGIDPATRGWVASEIASMTIGTTLADEARSRVAALLASDDTPRDARSALRDALGIVATNDATFDAWRAALGGVSATR